MVEVFRTNVKDRDHANSLIDQIHKVFIGCKASFDLEDCDKILRVESLIEYVDACSVINLLNRFGCRADVLPDDDYCLSLIEPTNSYPTMKP